MPWTDTSTDVTDTADTDTGETVFVKIRKVFSVPVVFALRSLSNIGINSKKLIFQLFVFALRLDNVIVS